MGDAPDAARPKKNIPASPCLLPLNPYFRGREFSLIRFELRARELDLPAKMEKPVGLVISSMMWSLSSLFRF